MSKGIKFKIEKIDENLSVITDMSEADVFGPPLENYLIEKRKILDKAILKTFSTEQLQTLQNQISLELEERLSEVSNG